MDGRALMIFINSNFMLWNIMLIDSGSEQCRKFSKLAISGHIKAFDPPPLVSNLWEMRSGGSENLTCFVSRPPEAKILRFMNLKNAISKGETA